MRVVLCVVALISVAAAKMQNVTVKGTVICDKRRLPNVLVELWERDTLDPNDKLSEVKTDSEGVFTVTGGQSEVGSIEPFIRFKHSCHVKKAGCIRSTEYEIPKKNINGAAYDMTYVNLDIVSAVDKEKC